MAGFGKHRSYAWLLAVGVLLVVFFVLWVDGEQPSRWLPVTAMLAWQALLPALLLAEASCDRLGWSLAPLMAATLECAGIGAMMIFCRLDERVPLQGISHCPAGNGSVDNKDQQGSADAAVGLGLLLLIILYIVTLLTQLYVRQHTAPRPHAAAVRSAGWFGGCDVSVVDAGPPRRYAYQYDIVWWALLASSVVTAALLLGVFIGEGIVPNGYFSTAFQLSWLYALLMLNFLDLEPHLDRPALLVRDFVRTLGWVGAAFQLIYATFYTASHLWWSKLGVRSCPKDRALTGAERDSATAQAVLFGALTLMALVNAALLGAVYLRGSRPLRSAARH
jgi:hypothetical protein